MKCVAKVKRSANIPGAEHDDLIGTLAAHGSDQAEIYEFCHWEGGAVLQRLMKLYCAYYEQSRAHLSLSEDAPIPRAIAMPSDGRVVAIPQVTSLSLKPKVPSLRDCSHASCSVIERKLCAGFQARHPLERD